jgi:hypothetical protein
MFAGEKISSSSNFGSGPLPDAGESVAIDLAVADDFFGDIGFVVEGRRGWRYVGRIRRCTGGRLSCRPAAVNRRNASGLYALDRRFRNSIRILAQIVFDAVFTFANLIGPDGPPILEVNSVSGR